MYKDMGFGEGKQHLGRQLQPGLLGDGMAEGSFGEIDPGLQ